MTSHTSLDLSGAVVLITGSAGGHGRAYALAAAQAAPDVAICDVGDRGDRDSPAA